MPLDHFGLGHDPTAKVAVTIHQQKQFQDKLCVVVEGDKKHLEAIVNSKLIVLLDSRASSYLCFLVQVVPPRRAVLVAPVSEVPPLCAYIQPAICHMPGVRMEPDLRLTTTSRKNG